MKRKELINLAKKIAKLETIIQNGTPEESAKAQDEIMKISGQVKNFEDLIVIDEIVMDLLNKS